MHANQLFTARPIRMAICALLLGHFSAAAMAQESTDPMEVCYRMSDADKRHACFDQEMLRRHTAGVKAPAPVIAAPPTAAPNVKPPAPARPADTIGLDGKQLIIKRKEAGIQPEPVKPLVAAIARLTSRPGHLYYFELDNGQVWESTDTQGEVYLGPHETVTIRPGVLGAFFLKTPEGLSIRVHRLR